MELLYFGSKGWGDELFAAFLMTIAVSITAMLIGILFSIIFTPLKLSNNKIFNFIANFYTTGILGLLHSLGMGLFPLFAQLIMDLDGNNLDSWRLSWLWIGVSVWIISFPLVFFTMIDDPKKLNIKESKYLSQNTQFPCNLTLEA